jgi:hypothetical protein
LDHAANSVAPLNSIEREFRTTDLWVELEHGIEKVTTNGKLVEIETPVAINRPPILKPTAWVRAA